jgi:hypothetical protein
MTSLIIDAISPNKLGLQKSRINCLVYRASSWPPQHTLQHIAPSAEGTHKYFVCEYLRFGWTHEHFARMFLLESSYFQEKAFFFYSIGYGYKPDEEVRSNSSHVGAC